MENSSKLQEWASVFSEWFNGQVWYQQIKGKWDELDPQNRLLVQVGSLVGMVLILILILFSFLWSVHSLKKELADKRALLSLLQKSNDEMRVLKASIPSQANRASEGGNWTPYFETIATSSGIDKASLTLSSEKPGFSSEEIKETLMDLSVKHINLKQALRFSIALENGNRPVKIRNLMLDSKSDLEGYLDLTLSLSGFTWMEPK